MIRADEDEILDKILTIFDGRVGSQIEDKEEQSTDCTGVAGVR